MSVITVKGRIPLASRLDKESELQITQCLDLVRSVLGNDLLAMYLYGSALVGGLQRYSDIDLFVVSNRATSLEEKTKLAKSLLQISGVYMKSAKKPIELTLVQKSEISPWHYPPHFDFQYGDWLRKEFESGNMEPWATTENPNLALLITQLLLANRTIFGPGAEQLLCKVPYRDFLAATSKELGNLKADFDWDIRNVLLTFARIWSTIETNLIRSKQSAAAWVIHRMPDAYRPVMERARAICLGSEEERWDDLQALLHPSRDFLFEKMIQAISARSRESLDVFHRACGGAG